MQQSWQLQEAKSKFSQVVDLAIAEGPQIVTRHGKEAVMIISYAEYRRLTTAQPNLYDFFRNSPLVSNEIDLTRIDSPLPEPLEL